MHVYLEKGNEMNQRTTVEAMQAVLKCKKIGQAAAIYAVQAIANEFVSKFQDEMKRVRDDESDNNNDLFEALHSIAIITVLDEDPLALKHAVRIAKETINMETK